MEILNVFLYHFVLDVIVMLVLKKLFKLQVKTRHLLLLQVLSLCAIALNVFVFSKSYQYLLCKISFGILICLLITNAYNAKDLFELCAAYIIFMFAIFGFAVFMTEFTKVVIYEIVGKKIKKTCDFIVLLGVVLFVLIISFFAKVFSKTKTLNSFLSKVSFYLFGKHIEITGLLDSGNMLYDTKSGKPVVVISVVVLKQLLPFEDYKKFIQGDYSSVRLFNKLNYVAAGGKSHSMPIFDIGTITISINAKNTKKECVIGVVNQEFENGKYQCLLHRDFV